MSGEMLTSSKVGQDPMEQTDDSGIGMDTEAAVETSEGDAMLESPVVVEVETRATQKVSPAASRGGYTALPPKEKEEVITVPFNQSSYDNLSWEMLEKINKAQEAQENKKFLDENLGGPAGLAALLGTSIDKGLSPQQVEESREKFGQNVFPEKPMDSFLELFIGAFYDPVLILLMAACVVSIILGVITDPEHGYVEGVAIFIAVFLVAIITAVNDYSKELQFRALEKESQNDERASVIRGGEIERINPIEIVVGDIVLLQAGDAIPADAVTLESHVVKCNESALTGEPDDLPKSKDKDPFLISSCLMTEGEEVRCVVIGIGPHSQWGIIKAGLVTESVNTPLQDKLEDMTELIGYIGMGAALGTLIASLIRIFTVDKDEYENVGQGVIQSFILAVTIVVVAIPEGLPLAVTIALAYSTQKMYAENCLIRVLAACETMGNCTNICSDKTGTLTENRMTVVEGYFGNESISQDDFVSAKTRLSAAVVRLIAEQAAINRSAYLVYKDAEGNVLDRPSIIGNKTEGALILMAKAWGFEYENLHKELFREGRDQTFSFNSTKKRATAIIHRADGSVTLFCKGATEVVLKDCTHVLGQDGQVGPLTEPKRSEIIDLIDQMANRALRTLCLAHKTYKSAADLPSDWREKPPDYENLIVDAIVGIIDPLRDDVKQAVADAQRAGVTVRMVTGDNIATARAIARQCGILTENGESIEGPAFRNMSPADVDKILPNLQVMGRSSPDDKYLLVARLNGTSLPKTEEEWQQKHGGKAGVSWATHKDLLLPGYREEWERTRPEGGEVVGVTGDGTNDAPALKAADVGLSMGITGTKVAQGASDIVIRDDKFSSIVTAIKWGRSVYDSIRKFLQFQLTVNLVALTLVFVAACSGTLTPLNAVQMLWVNLIMDTMGALALATELPSDSMMDRRPYKRDTSLVSLPMWRNIAVQTVFQLIVVFVLLFAGAKLFGVKKGEWCKGWSVDGSGTWDAETGLKYTTGAAPTYALTCQDFNSYCGAKFNGECFESSQMYDGTASLFPSPVYFNFKDSLVDFEDDCLKCEYHDYTHGSLIFNAFIFCQIFNEYTSRDIFDKWNFLDGLETNYVFLGVSLFSIGAQVFLIEAGGHFVKTSHLTVTQWFITMAIGAIGLLFGIAMRFIPVKEDESSFFVSQIDMAAASSAPATAGDDKDGLELVDAKNDMANITV